MQQTPVLVTVPLFKLCSDAMGQSPLSIRISNFFIFLGGRSLLFLKGFHFSRMETTLMDKLENHWWQPIFKCLHKVVLSGVVWILKYKLLWPSIL